MKYVVTGILFLLAAPVLARTDVFQKFAEESWVIGLGSASKSPTECTPELMDSAKVKAERVALQSCRQHGYRTKECNVLVSEIEVDGRLSTQTRYKYGLGCNPRDPDVCGYLEGLGSYYGCIAKAIVLGKMED